MGRCLQTNNKLLSSAEQTARHSNASLQLQKRPTTSPINSRLFQGLPKCLVSLAAVGLPQITLLCALVDRGVSPARASVVLKRPRLAVQNKAIELGTHHSRIPDKYGRCG